MNSYLGASRYWFNQAVEYLKTPGTKADLYAVRKVVLEKEQPEWALGCPQRVREHSVKAACEAVKNAKKKCMKGGGFQEVKFRSRKDNVQGFGFDAQNIGEDFVFGSAKFRVEFRPSEPIEEHIEGTRIVREDDRWFAILPQLREVKKPENQRHGLVALDPGVRTFMSFYSKECSGKIGEGDFKKIYRLCLSMDNLEALRSVAKSKRKRRLRKALGRLRWRIYDLVSELHKKTAYFLVTNFDAIVIPPFESSQMVTKLRSKTARAMLTFAHYRFRQFLTAKAEEYSCELVVESEEYTSKTCSYCGKIHDIGSAKFMKCCAGKVDRDLNGARGIFLRALSVRTSLRRRA